MKKYAEMVDLLEKLDKDCLVENPTPEALEAMRDKFVYITVFGEIIYSDNSLIVWQDKSGNMAIIDRIWREASVFYAGSKYVIDTAEEA